jgi:hypothetical protein
MNQPDEAYMLTRTTLLVDRNLLDRARKILRRRTDAERVPEALDRVVFRNEVAQGIRKMAGSKSMRDIFREGA